MSAIMNQEFDQVYFQDDPESLKKLRQHRRGILSYERWKVGERWITWSGLRFFFVFSSLGIFLTLLALAALTHLWTIGHPFLMLWASLIAVACSISGWKGLWSLAFWETAPDDYRKHVEAVHEVYVDSVRKRYFRHLHALTQE